jgi:hypothetical protein
MHHTPLCELCKSMGHDVNNCWSLQLMQDHTHDVFWVEDEHKGGDHGCVERGGYQGGPRGSYGCIVVEDMEEEEVAPHLFQLWKNWSCVKVLYQTAHSLCVLL